MEGTVDEDDDDNDDVKLNMNGAQIVLNWMWLGLPRARIALTMSSMLGPFNKYPLKRSKKKKSLGRGWRTL